MLQSCLLFAVLQNTETTIKLFFDSKEEVEQAVLEMPKDLPGSSVHYEDASGGYCSPWRAYIQGRQLLVHNNTKLKL